MSQKLNSVDVRAETVFDNDKPEVDFKEPLKAPCRVETYKDGKGRVVYGMFPISGDEQPRFYGEATVRAKPAGPLPDVILPFRFSIVKAKTPVEAFEMFDHYVQFHEPKAKQAAAKEWNRQYGQMARQHGVAPQGLVDAVGNPL